MRMRTAGLSALLFLAYSAVAAAGPIVDAATRAEALAAQGNTAEALQALDEAVDAIWKEGPLAFRKVAVVSSSSGEGVYEERSELTLSRREHAELVQPSASANAPWRLHHHGFLGNLTSRCDRPILVERRIFLLSPLRANKREFGIRFLAFPYLRPARQGDRDLPDQNARNPETSNPVQYRPAEGQTPYSHQRGLPRPGPPLLTRRTGERAAGIQGVRSSTTRWCSHQLTSSRQGDSTRGFRQLLRETRR